MDYCGPRGIELDAFLRWSPRSQEAALDWAAYENQRCKGCGTHPADWAEDEFAFHAHAKECKGCARQQQLSASIGQDERGIFAAIAQGSAAACPQCSND